MTIVWPMCKARGGHEAKGHMAMRPGNSGLTSVMIFAFMILTFKIHGLVWWSQRAPQNILRVTYSMTRVACLLCRCFYYFFFLGGGVSAWLSICMVIGSFSDSQCPGK